MTDRNPSILQAIGLAVLLLVLFTSPVFAAQQTKPNLVLFIADDFTCADVAPCGSPNTRTPILSRLAGYLATLDTISKRPNYAIDPD